MTFKIFKVKIPSCCTSVPYQHINFTQMMRGMIIRGWVIAQTRFSIKGYWETFKSHREIIHSHCTSTLYQLSVTFMIKACHNVHVLLVAHSSSSLNCQCVLQTLTNLLPNVYCRCQWLIDFSKQCPTMQVYDTWMYVMLKHHTCLTLGHNNHIHLQGLPVINMCPTVKRYISCSNRCPFLCPSRWWWAAKLSRSQTKYICCWPWTAGRK